MNFVPVWSYNDYVSAHLDMGRLKNEGFDCWLKDEHSVTVNPVLSNSVGGIKLMVDATKIQQAWEVVMRDKVCPKCGSHDIHSRDIPRKPALWFESVFVFFLGKNALGFEKIFRCANCGNEFPEPVPARAPAPRIPD